ncbi:hypothetical protein FRC12_011049, partial [Ceratobasidium sp. 428]
HRRDGEFCWLVKSTAMHHALRYAHIPWQRLLYVTQSSSVKEAGSGRIEVNSQLLKVWGRVRGKGEDCSSGGDLAAPHQE